MAGKPVFDLIVIGAGPAGLMAAGQSAMNGSQTLLLEKMDKPGRKLRITGKGRCNITNDMPLEKFLAHFGDNGKFLRQSFHRFFNDELLEFFKTIGVPTQTERGGRVFPKSNDANDLTEKLVRWTQNAGSELRVKTPVKKILEKGRTIRGVETESGERIYAKNVLVATGGSSYTGTGSSGDGFKFAAELGHTIIPIRPALVPIRTAGRTAKDLQGLSLRNVRASIIVENKTIRDEFGEMMFTHFGVSGPIILTMSGLIVDLLRDGKRVNLSIDLKPALDENTLDARLQRDFDVNGKMMFQNVLKGLLPAKMIQTCIKETRIPTDKPCHQISHGERLRLRTWLKDFQLTIIGFLPLEAAMVTQGGVALNEIDPRTISSRLVDGLYFAGEVLDLAADTGGFNLQAAFSTGWLAGKSIGKKQAK